MSAGQLVSAWDLWFKRKPMRCWQADSRAFFLLDPSSGQLQKLEHPEAHLPDNRFNDAKCDPQGRLWAGTMSCLETAGVGHLYCMDLEGKVSAQLDGITISNGLAWSQDQRTMYYIDTPTRRIDALDFDSETGSISQRRSAFEIPDGMGYPDGMTIDAQGRLWVALWAGWGVGCWDPTSGELLGKVELPVECVTSCCFGGPIIKRSTSPLPAETWIRRDGFNNPWRAVCLLPRWAWVVGPVRSIKGAFRERAAREMNRVLSTSDE